MIAVLGLGFVGLSTALGLAHKTDQLVRGFDIDQMKRQSLSHGILPFHEPYMATYLETYLGKKFFIANSLEETLVDAEIIFICVGTPQGEKGGADLTYIKQAIEESLACLDKSVYPTIVIKSTVPPTTTASVIKPFIEEKGWKIGKDIGLANNPEFLREGYAWQDFIEPDRIVIGENDSKGADQLEKLYEPFQAPIFRVSSNTGEFIKYVSNSLLATLISFSNELAMIGETLEDVQIDQAFSIIQMDKRWIGNPANMTSYVYPGCGFGGYCLPKDTKALTELLRDKGYEASLLDQVIQINDKIKKHTVKKVLDKVSLEQPIGILGLSFKPGSDDVRNSPSEDIINLLLMWGYDHIYVYDPIAMDNFKANFSKELHYADTIDELIEKVEAVIVLTAWDEFKGIRHKLCKKILIDGRYFLE